jgi:hypothetical protein
MAETFTHLEIKNWDRYQPKDSKNLPWIRDYKDKEFDPDYHKLTIMQRYMLDACCRLRGRYGRVLPNDPQWLLCATAVPPRERHNATTAIQQLINRGFLLLTNEQVNPLVEVRKGEIRKEISVNGEPKTETQEPEVTPVILEIQPPDEYEQERNKENEIIEAAFEHYCVATEKNRLTYRLTPQRRKVGVTRLRDCLKLTKGDYEKAAGLLRVAIDKLSESDWHMGRDPGTKGKKYCDWINNLFKSYERMEAWFNA